MKRSVQFLTVVLVLAIFASCGSNQDLQQRSPAQFSDVYYTKSGDGLTLHLPVIAIQENRVNLQAVYFQGLKSPLVKSEDRPNLYIAEFRTGSGDMVMDVNPVKEFGNKPPQLPQESPYSIDNDEAILVFSQGGKTKFYKLTGIVEKE